VINDDVHPLLTSLATPREPFIELFLEDTSTVTVEHDAGHSQPATVGRVQGVGARAGGGEQLAYGSTNATAKVDIVTLIRQCQGLARTTSGPVSLSSERAAISAVRKTRARPKDLQGLGHRLDELVGQARRECDNLTDLSVSVTKTDQDARIVTSEGRDVRRSQSSILLSVTAVAEQNGKRASAIERQIHWDELDAARLAVSIAAASRRATQGVRADVAPMGQLPVVFGPGTAAVLLHEACGHPREGDLLGRGRSALADLEGQKVSNSELTILDHPTVQGGAYNSRIDDEGTITEVTALMDRGVLGSPLVDRSTAYLLNRSPTGNGRRVSYAYPPLPRRPTWLSLLVPPKSQILLVPWIAVYGLQLSALDKLTQLQASSWSA
jgi:TldD protein